MENYEATFFFLPGKSTDLGLAEAMEWKGQFLTGLSSATEQFRAISHPGEIKASWPPRSFRQSEAQRVKKLPV